ncbi:MAG: hypothetical protein U5K69_23380 [Balneolaceae bacterium]|nr:hypothetical protein [Balneolaceae bacterium]
MDDLKILLPGGPVLMLFFEHGSEQPQAILHGGAAGVGALKGNKNVLKRGLYTKEAKQANRELKQLVKDARSYWLNLIEPATKGMGYDVKS